MRSTLSYFCTFVGIVQGCFLLKSTSSMNKAMCQHFGTQTKVIIFWKYNFHAVKVSEPYWIAICWHYSSTSTADTVLHQSTTPPILCGDAKLGAISSFLRNSITKQQPGALCICGAPATGKTACLTHWKARRYDHLPTCVLLQPPVHPFLLVESSKKPPML